MNPILVLLVLFVSCSYSQNNGNGLAGNISLTEGTIQERQPTPPAPAAGSKEITCKDVFGNVRLLCHDSCFQMFDLNVHIHKCTDKVCDYSINKVYKDLDEGTLMLKTHTTSCKDKLKLLKGLCQKRCSKVFRSYRNVVPKCRTDVCTHMVKHGIDFANQQDGLLL